jgi:CBS domain containing-hemolysin-like protein
MTTPAVTIAARALNLLAEHDVTGLPVLDSEGHVVGAVTDLDLIRALAADADLRTALVADVVQARPLFVEPETDLSTVADLMEEWRVRRLPVCEKGRVVGVISRGDVLAYLFATSLSHPPRRSRQPARKHGRGAAGGLHSRDSSWASRSGSGASDSSVASVSSAASSASRRARRASIAAR